VRKVITIVCLLLGSCSLIRKQESIIATTDKEKAAEISAIAGNNLTGIDFSLQKVEIIIEEDGKKQKFMGNIKYKNPDVFLISIRNYAGIEGMRIYIDRDTVLANDRINKKLYYGSSERISLKYGINRRYLATGFGDLVIERDKMNKETECEKGLKKIINNTGDFNVKFTVDCRIGKIIRTEFSRKENSEKDKTSLSFSHFKKLENVIYPEVIMINNSINKTNIYINIKKAEKYNGDDIIFIPGNNYEAVLLK